MRVYKLKNGLTIVYERRKTASVAIQVNVKVGSNYELLPVSGISHFIEHMLFEGTKNRMDSKIIANEIEKLGGELNAYTSDERTTYYIKVLKKHFDVGLDILADIIQNPLFRKHDIEKERKIILSEIKLVLDEPRHHQWILFERTLFKKHPAGNPTYGTVAAVRRINRSNILDFYLKYYVPNNIIITVVGDVPKLKSKIESAFVDFKKGVVPKLRKVREPKQTRIQKSVEKRQISSSYAVLGYKTACRKDKDSLALDLIKAILGRGQSGRVFYEIRTKRGLAYDVGVHNEAASDYGTFSVYFSTHKKNINTAVSVILDEFEKLKNLSEDELKEAKDYIEGTFLLQNEDTYQMSDTLGFWQIISDARKMKDYINNIKEIKLFRIKKVAEKYLNKNYTLAVIKQVK